jgi:hypothetical protein
MSASRCAARLAALAVLALVASGCVAFRQGQVTDNLQSWSAIPLAPDERIATEAIKSNVCHATDVAGPVSVVLQDRRTVLTAAFLVAGPGWTGSCLLTLANGNAIGSSGNLASLPAMGQAVALDESANGGVGDGNASLAGGRSIDAVVAVSVELVDGRVVTASVGGGHWLAWWPGDVAITQLVATGADGAVLASIEDPLAKLKQP